MDSAPPCDLDPVEWNLATAFFDHRVGFGRWRAARHGVGTVDVLEACGCVACVGELDRRTAYRDSVASRTPPAPPRHVDIAPVRVRVRELLAAGWSRTGIAVAAGVDQATIDRVLRPDVQRVRRETGAGILALVPEGETAKAGRESGRPRQKERRRSTIRRLPSAGECAS